MISGMSEGESLERHRAVEATRGEPSEKHSASTERLRAVFEGLDVGMILKDAEGKPIETNPALRKMLGYGEEELRGMVRSDFTVSEDAERDAELYRQLLAGERDSFRIEKRYVRKDGGIMWGRLSVSRIEGAEGEPAFAVGVVEDITEHKDAEEKLRESEARLAEAQRIAHLGIWEWDVKTGEVFWSDDTFRIYGYEPKEVEPTVDKLMKLVHPDDRELVRKKIDTALHEGEPYDFEHRIVRPNGQERTVHRQAEVYLDEGGQPSRMAGTVHDITQRKRAEEKLRQSEERFRSLIQNASDLITVLDEDGTISYQSPTIERILGYLPEERIGQNAFDYLHPDDEEWVKDSFVEALDNPGEVRPPVEFRLRHKDGSWRHMEATRTNLLDDPAVNGVVANLRDITERKRAEEKLRESEERYRAVMEQSAEAIWLFDPDTKQVLESNTAFQELLGYSAEELCAMTNYDFVAHSRKDIDATVWRKGQEEKVPPEERKYRRADGTLLDVEVKGTLISYGGKEVVCSVARDLTGRKETEKALRESEERFRSAFEDSPIGVALVDLDGRRFRLNRALCEMLGYSEDELLCDYLDHVHPDDREISSEHLRRLLEEGTGNYTLERRYLHADGHVVCNLTSVSLIQDSRGAPSHLVCLHQDITERKELEEQLRHQAFYDSLTDLPNRVLFLDRLGHALARASREDSPVAVLFIDLDGFKVVNDSLGHDTGNAVLVEVAERLQASVRPGDTVGRIFGDEFAVLLEAPSGEEEACRVTERIQKGLQAPFEVDRQEIFLSASIGVALSESNEDQPNEVLRHADLAMYEVKNTSNVRYRVYDPSMDTRLVERMNLERDLRQALEREELEVHYQPKVLLETEAIVGMEALVRWQHPERGLLPASQFILQAEETGLIDQIGLWVLKESCRQLKEWQVRYSAKLGMPFGMCVNLSAREIRQPDLAEKVASVLQDTGLDPSCLMLEITERTAKEEAEQTIVKLRELKDLGVQLAIDDFGTGYCSLLYLEHSLLDVLKIDYLIMHRDREDSEEYEAVLSAMTSMAHSLSLEVIVEGVETEEQLAKLKEMGCEMAQGYYFAEPLPSEALENLLVEAASCR